MEFKFEEREYNGATSMVAPFQAKLVDINSKVFTNSKGTEYAVCTIDLEGKKVTAITYNENPDDLRIDGTVECEVSVSPDRENPDFRVLWNEGGASVSFDDLGLDKDAILSGQQATVEA